MRLAKLIPKAIRRHHVAYRTRLWPLYRRFRESVTVTTKQGVFTLPLTVDDPISRLLFTERQFELDFVSDAMSFIRTLNHLPKGKGTVLDVGANNGVISIGMLVTGELEKAVVIEPDPRNFSLLTHNVAQNKLEAVMTCLNCAVSDSKSTLQFELSEDNYGDHRVRRSVSDATLEELHGESNRQVIDVESDTLDNLFAGLDEAFRNDIAVVWIDVQGHEGYAFLGGRSLLSSGVPVVAEIWPYGIHRSGMSQEAFCAIAGGIWSAYWVRRRGKFVKYPIEVLYTYFDELGYDGDYDNVIFT